MRDTSVTRLGASVLRNREPTGVIAVVSSHEVHDDWPASYAGSRAGGAGQAQRGSQAPGGLARRERSRPRTSRPLVT